MPKPIEYTTPRGNCNVNYGLWRLTENELMVAGREGWRKGRSRAPGGELKHRERPPRRRNKEPARWQLPGKVHLSRRRWALRNWAAPGPLVPGCDGGAWAGWEMETQLTEALHSLTHSLIYSCIQWNTRRVWLWKSWRWTLATCSERGSIGS